MKIERFNTYETGDEMTNETMSPEQALARFRALATTLQNVHQELAEMAGRLRPADWEELLNEADRAGVWPEGPGVAAYWTAKRLGEPKMQSPLEETLRVLGEGIAEVEKATAGAPA